MIKQDNKNKFIRLPEKNAIEVQRLVKSLERHMEAIEKRAIELSHAGVKFDHISLHE